MHLCSLPVRLFMAVGLALPISSASLLSPSGPSSALTEWFASATSSWRTVVVLVPFHAAFFYQVFSLPRVSFRGLMPRFSGFLQLCYSAIFRPPPALALRSPSLSTVPYLDLPFSFNISRLIDNMNSFLSFGGDETTAAIECD